MSDAAKWYVIHTYSGYEGKVAENIKKVVKNRNLDDLILEVEVPTEKVTEITDGKSREVERKTFPGYVMIKMVYNEDSDLSKEAWYVIRNTRGVTGFVGPASEPTPLTENEVIAMGIGISKDKPQTVTVNFSEGDIVRVSGTSMDGFEGTVHKIDTEKGTVEVLVSMLGRETPVILNLNQVVKSDDSGSAKSI